MRQSRVILIALCVCLACGGLTASPAASLAESTGIRFDKQRYLDDYDYLWETLYECYPHFNTLRRRGVDVERVRRDARAKLEERLETNDDFLVFYNAIADLCDAMGNFAHLYPISASYYAENIVPYGDDDTFSLWYGVFETQPTADLYARLISPEVTGRNPYRSSSGSTMRPDIYLYPEEKIGYIHIYSFVSALLERDRERIAGFLRDTAAYEHIIIDITGNGGGMLEYWWDTLVKPLGGTYSYERYWFFTKAATGKMIQSIPKEQIVRTDELPAPAFFAHEADRAGLDYVWPQKTTVMFGKAEIEHHAKRWVLIDGSSYSAADQFAAFCKDTGWATLVGTNTMGDGAGVAPVFLQLPGTGLVVRFHVNYTLNDDGTSNAETGTAPDIRCEARERPVMACLKQIGAEGGDVGKPLKNPVFIGR